MMLLIKKYSWEVFLFFITLISYGQMFWMGIWQDDNAIFFKLQHINEAAGFFGKGLIGEGPYRFSFTPYWFIYKIFGEGSTLPYYLFIYGADARAGLVRDIVASFINKKFYIIYGFLSSISNVFVQYTLTAKFFDWQVSLIKITSIGLPYVILGTLALSIFGIYLLFKGKKNSKRIILFLSLVIFICSIYSNLIFNVPIINLNETSNYVVYLGGIILIYLFAITYVINKKVRDKYLFLLLSFLLSIAAYWAYQPLISLNTTHRYLTGTFAILTGLLAFIYINSNKKIKALIITWWLLNLIGSFSFQTQILSTRSFPVDSFYRQLKSYVPKIAKGDLFYFDLGDTESRNYFQSAISTASMPNETSFAWRYGIDRSELKITDNYLDFIELIKSGNITFDHLHTFYYTKDGLIDTTYEMRKLLQTKSFSQKVDFTTQNINDELKINLKTPIASLTPTEINLTVLGNPPLLNIH